ANSATCVRRSSSIAACHTETTQVGSDSKEEYAGTAETTTGPPSGIDQTVSTGGTPGGVGSARVSSSVAAPEYIKVLAGGAVATPCRTRSPETRSRNGRSWLAPKASAGTVHIS